MHRLELTKGHTAIVDDVGYSLVSSMKWTYRNDGYAARQMRIEGKRKYVAMHLFIYKPVYGEISEGLIIDHRNGNRLDNTLENLQAVTYTANALNRRCHRNGRKAYRNGVTRYRSQLWYNHKAHYIGLYSTPEEAIEARERKRLELLNGEC